MKQNFILTHNVLLSAGILLSLFAFGGIIQVAGLSITKTNFVICLAIALSLLFSNSRSHIKDGERQYTLPLCFFGIYISINAFLTRTPGSYYLLYFYLFTLVPFAGAIFSEKMLGKNENVFYFTRSFFYILAVIQIPILFFQTMFDGEISSILSHSISNIRPIDVCFGSFFIKSDYTLTLFMNVLAVNLLWHFKKQLLIRYVLLVVLLFAIAMTNSKMGLLVFFYILNVYWIKKMFSFNTMMPGILLPIVTIAVFIIISEVDFHTLFSNLYHEINRIEVLSFKGKSIPRYGVLLILMPGKLNLWGYGLFDYYDYFSMHWKFYAGHSLWLTIYNDIGLVGVCLVIWILSGIIHKSIRTTAEGFCYFSILVCYSFISVIFTDLGAMVIICFFMQTYPRVVQQLKRPEEI